MLRHPIFVTAILVAGLLCATPAYAGAEKVPDVVGLNAQEAEALMQEAGFPVEIQYVTGRPIGIVFSQEPGGLAERDTSETVTLQVGGPTPKPGPAREPQPSNPSPADDPPSDLPPVGPDDTGGMGAPPAGAMEPGTVPNDLGAGARPPTGTDRPADPDPSKDSGRTWPDDPVSAPPAATTGFTWKGQPVPGEELADSNGPDLPGVLGQPAGRARSELRRYRVRVEQTHSMPELVGQVLNQWPFAGTRLALGEEVTIVIGVASLPSSNHRGVPQVQDQPWREACSRVERVGFGVRLTAVPSPNAKRGLIVMQTPLPGSLLELGQTMHLRIGAGEGRYVPGQPESGATREPAAPVVRRDPPADVPPRHEPEAPPEDEPAIADEPAAPEGAGTSGSALSAPAQRDPPADQSYPYKYGANFTWTAVAGATGYELEIQEELPSGAWQQLSSESSQSTSFRPERLERGRYRWRVRALSGETAGRWSGFRRLYMY